MIWILVAVVAVIVAVAFGSTWVLAPLAGFAIYKVGTAMLRSMAVDGKAPDGPPEVVVSRPERVLYWCEACGAELLLVVRGADTPPRHCGERMHQRIEVVRH